MWWNNIFAQTWELRSWQRKESLPNTWEKLIFFGQLYIIWIEFFFSMTFSLIYFIYRFYVIFYQYLNIWIDCGSVNGFKMLETLTYVCFCLWFTLEYSKEDIPTKIWDMSKTKNPFEVTGNSFRFCWGSSCSLWIPQKLVYLIIPSPPIYVQLFLKNKTVPNIYIWGFRPLDGVFGNLITFAQIFVFVLKNSSKYIRKITWELTNIMCCLI